MVTFRYAITIISLFLLSVTIRHYAAVIPTGLTRVQRLALKAELGKRLTECEMIMQPFLQWRSTTAGDNLAWNSWLVLQALVEFFEAREELGQRVARDRLIAVRLGYPFVWTYILYEDEPVQDIMTRLEAMKAWLQSV